eukprot:1160283-Pelagomonas_calceolata.AAC.2
MHMPEEEHLGIQVHESRCVSIACRSRRHLSIDCVVSAQYEVLGLGTGMYMGNLHFALKLGDAHGKLLLCSHACTQASK